MDPYIFGIGIPLAFTLFGYVWGSRNRFTKKDIETIVGRTMDNLEADGYLKSKMINGELHYIKWPKVNEKDL